MSTLALINGRAFGFNEQTSADKIALLKSVYKPTAATRIVGSRCIESCDRQYSINQLFKLAGIDDATTPAQLVNAFQSRRKADFQNGNTETVNGWVLARSETSMISILSQI